MTRGKIPTRKIRVNEKKGRKKKEYEEERTGEKCNNLMTFQNLFQSEWFVRLTEALAIVEKRL